MSHRHSALLFLLAILIAEQGLQLPPPRPPVMTQDEIRAARETFDREMKLDTKRPWDGMDLTGPNALEKPRGTDKKQ
jgi:hypothetical protein